mgnify:FL=1
MQSTDLEATKKFYTGAFGWSFIDYGETYMAISNAGMDGGFEKVDEVTKGGVMVIMYHEDLPVAQEAIVANGGVISQETFSFPGGKRFHFTDPSGNELAVWSEA